MNQLKNLLISICILMTLNGCQRIETPLKDAVAPPKTTITDIITVTETRTIEDVGQVVVYAYSEYIDGTIVLATPDDRPYPPFDINNVAMFKVGDIVEIEIVNEFDLEGRHYFLMATITKNHTRPEVVYPDG